MMSRFYYAETQAIEGLNSIVKLLGRRCPSITLELLSSRLAIKRMIGQADGITGCRKKWSTVKALAEREVAELSQYATQALPVLADASRWSKAPAVPLAAPLSAQQAAIQCNSAPAPNHGNAINAPAHAPPKTVSPETVTWAKSYNLGWKWRTGGGKQKKKPSTTHVKQQHSQCGFGVAILPTPDMQETAFYLTADYFSHSVSFTRLRQCKQRVEVDGHIHVHDCLQWGHDRSSFADTVESTLLFAQYFETCSRHAQSVPVHSCFLDPSLCKQLFMNPGWLRVDDVMAKSVLLFEMTSSLMKGVSAPKPKKVGATKPKTEKQRTVQPEVEALGDSMPTGHACEGVSAAESDHDHEHDYMHGEHATSELRDTSGSEVDDCTEGVGDDDGANAASAEKETQELKAFVNTAAGVPSRREIAHATDEVAQAGCISPIPEMQEEALLLLVRQRNALRGQRRSSNTTGRTQPVLDGVGDVYSCPGTSSPAGVCSDDSDSDDIKHTNTDDCEFSILGQSPAEDDDMSLQTLRLWASGFVTMLKALQAVRAMQSGTVLGSRKSVSLVSMKPTRVADCNCVRCKWGSDVDMPEILFVHWLNNSPTYGLIGRKARQVNLDQDNKVLYSAADATMARTGIRSGLGFPELVCDEKHCDILIPYVGAAMRKVKKTSPERDPVPPACLDFQTFCVLMISRLTAPASSSQQSPAVRDIHQEPLSTV